MARIIDLSPSEAMERIGSGDAVLIDVREGFEHRSAAIPGAELHPLSSFDPERVRAVAGGREVIFHCRSGKRSAEAAHRFAPGEDAAHHLAGGILAWEAAGLETRRSSSAPKIDVMRQVQIAAGSLVLAGVVLGAFVHPGFLGISAFVGAGLTFAGLSGWCGMAKLLAKMPWNRTNNESAPQRAQEGAPA